MRYAVLVTFVLGFICIFATMAHGHGAALAAKFRVIANYQQMEAEGMTSAHPLATSRLTEGIESFFFGVGQNAALMTLVICITQLVVLFFVQRSFKRDMLAQMHRPQSPGPDANA